MATPAWFDRSVTPAMTPPRRPGSIRRTTSMELNWPQGRDGTLAITGRGRDLLTPLDGAAPTILSDQRLAMAVSPGKIIAEIATVPTLAGTAELVGQHALIGFRARLRGVEQGEGPLALLLDDVVGSNIISNWMWTRWLGDRKAKLAFVDRRAIIDDACIAYRSGSNVTGDGSYLDKVDFIPPLGRADDPLAFHPLQLDCDRTTRRVRRIDLWREGDVLWMDAMFQDSSVLPGTRRSGLHEYRLCASADALTGVLLSIEAHSGVLPHAECLRGPATVAALPGIGLAALRAHVLRDLRGAAGCTHLNDAARSLAEMSVLAGRLEA